MTKNVADSYDSVAELYASLFLDGLVNDAYAQDWLTTFAEMAALQTGVVADLGCGPGLVVEYLSDLGITAIGYDLSPGQVEQAREAFPRRQFHVGDLTALEDADATLGGIVSRYSLIHLLPSRLDDVFGEWLRALEPGAPVLVTFFGSLTAQDHGEAFYHTVATAYALFPTTIAQQLKDAGFVDIETDTRPPPEDGRPFDQGTVLARKPRASTS